MRALVCALAGIALSGCASLNAMHADYHCGHEGDDAWRVISAPEYADVYRAVAFASYRPSFAQGGGREIWFAREGDVKFCIVDTGPENPDCRGTPRGVAWEFEQTENGPRAGAAGYAVCVL